MAAPGQPPPTALRLPPHNLDSELAVLSACLLAPEKIDEVASLVQPGDFYHAPHRRIFGAVVEMRAEGVPIDTITVARRLQDSDTLREIGGPAYLVKVIDGTPAVHHVAEHAKGVSDLARRRRVIAEMQRLAAEGYGAVGPAWDVEAARAIATAAELGTRSRGVIQEAWKPLPANLLDYDPEPRRWLLRHPTFDGLPCAPGRGDGFIPLEKAGILVASGGAGKTYAMIQLAVSIVLGRPWFGHFHVTPEASKGRVCLALGEESMKDFHERLKKIADGMKLNADERRRVLTRIVALPLFSRPVELLGRAADGVTMTETEVYYGLRACLRDKAVLHHRECLAPLARGATPPPECHADCVHGWSLIVIDPLARWAGDVEGDNSAATRFVQIAESLTLVPGMPTVLVVHHSSKTARRVGGVDSRGVTAITDGFRWQGTLRTKSKTEMLFGQEKSNYSAGMEDLVLRRSHGGVLRVPTPEEDAEQASRTEDRVGARAAAKTAAEESRIDQAARELVSGLRRSRVAIRTRPEILALAKGPQSVKSAALTRLLASGSILKADDGYTVAETLSPSPELTRSADQEGAQLALV
jgi:hypothetical protein